MNILDGSRKVVMCLWAVVEAESIGSSLKFGKYVLSILRDVKDE